MIRYYVDLIFELKDTKDFGQIYRKNQSLTPKSHMISIRYEVKTKSLGDALEKLKPRMKDTKKYKFMKWCGGTKKKF